MKKIHVAGLIFGLVYLPVGMAKPEFRVDGFLSAAGGVMEVNPLYAATLDTNTMLANSLSRLTPTYNMIHTRPEIIGYNSKPDFQEESKVGLQGILDFNDKIGMTLQVISRGVNEWSVEAEWAFLSYQLADDWRMRAGRLRVPNFMLSDSLHVGYDHLWVRLPLEVYGLGPTDNYSGADLSYEHRFLNQNVEATVYYGSSTEVHETFYQPQLSRYRQILGANLVVGNEDVKVRASYMEANLQNLPNSDFALAIQNYATPIGPYTGQPTAASDFEYNSVKTSFLSFGAVINYDHWRLLGEWVETKANSAGVANQRAYYGTLGYRFAEVTPYIGYAHLLTTDKEARNYPGHFGVGANLNFGTGAQPRGGMNKVLNLLDQDQETYTVGLRYDIFTGTAIKFQADNIKALHGTNGLFNVNPKEAAILYSAIIDVVF